MYGSQTETAIAAMSRLAEVYDDGRTLLAAGDIARSRGLQPPFVAKILTALSQAGLVTGARGPGGGYTLAKPPDQITIRDVYILFERENTDPRCLFGGGVCGADEPCPLHEKLVRVQAAIDDLISNTTFAVFTGSSPDPEPATPPHDDRDNSRRKSFRATRPSPRAD